MVIVTIRDLGVLISWGLSNPCIYNMPALAKPDAKQLFCWHAFFQPSPPAEFETLVEEFLKACNGFPLSLKATSKLRSAGKRREMFLDVAYFFIGEEKSRAIAVWDGSGWSGLQGLETLMNKCLVELVEENLFNVFMQTVDVEIRIRMHDQLRDMGREIASSHSPYRLWCPQQIDDMKKEFKKRKQI
ncbi:hypothetical protein SUGI_0144530 [Cryptomeria japonica]|nr:hypothetical protein SUGI_0144530 [Cryptomeria japonica]